MRKLFLLAAFGLTGIISAQSYELKSDEMKGQIITKKGDVLNGYIKMNGDEMSPWKNQQKVEFFTEDAMSDGKVKGKERETFKPKDITAYVVDDRYFESMKISIAKLEVGIGIADWKFVERRLEGKISVYRVYDTPDPVSVTTSEEERVALEQEMERMRTEPNVILVKEGEDAVLPHKVNLAEYMADCPEVADKYSSGDYGIEPWNPDAETKMGKWIANQTNAEQFKAIMTEILTDYNNCGE